jgi:hypothetical protein
VIGRFALLGVLASSLAHAEPAATDPTQISLGAEVGGGRVTLLGAHYGSVDAGVDLAGARWLAPNIGVGLRVAYFSASPMSPPHMDGYPLARDIPWLVEPELLARTVSQSVQLHYGWMAVAGAGVAPLRTNELCGGGGHLIGDDEHPSSHSCIITIARDTALESSLTAGGYFDISHVQIFTGVRGSANTAGELAAGVVATAGATF